MDNLQAQLLGLLHWPFLSEKSSQVNIIMFLKFVFTNNGEMFPESVTHSTSGNLQQ